MNLPSEPSVIPVALSSREKARLQQRHALHCKYEKAVALYADTDMPMKDIATTKQRYAQALELYRNTTLTMKEIVRRTGVPAEGFRFYLHKWHKDLVIERLGISSNVSGHTDLRKARKRMKTVAAKYEEAIKKSENDPTPCGRSSSRVRTPSRSVPVLPA